MLASPSPLALQVQDSSDAIATSTIEQVDQPISPPISISAPTKNQDLDPKGFSAMFPIFPFFEREIS